MRKSILFFGIYLSVISAYSQTNIISDSLLLETCKTIRNSQEVDDSLKIDEAYKVNLSPIFSKLSDSLASVTFDYLYFRLQKLCPEYKKYFDKKNPHKSDWVSLETKPSSNLDKGICSEFPEHKNFYYFEENGDTVKMSLSDGFWIDHFKDGTYSKLKFAWTNDCDFEITFIESNNLIRKNLSKPGEKYKYRLIEKNQNYYLICLDMQELKILGTFKLYYY